MAQKRIHLIAPAGALHPFLAELRLSEPQQLLDLIQQAIGPDYEITADLEILTAREDEARGGRTDDDARARDIERSLGDERVAAVVALRGGAWLTRVLPRIDFGVIDRRVHRVAMIGFSELTTLVNIVGARPHGLGIYGLSPAFLAYGLRRHALLQALNSNDHHEGSATEWMRNRIRAETTDWFVRMVAMIEGREEPEPLSCQLVRGTLAESSTATFVGGNLTVLSTLVGSRFESCIDPTDRWIVIEDFNDKPERIDRFLAHFTLAGYWERCAGVLLGDFHQRERDIRPTVLTMLDYHMPLDRTVPVLTTDRIGHVWPMSPLPLHRPLRVVQRAAAGYEINWSAELTRVV